MMPTEKTAARRPDIMLCTRDPQDCSIFENLAARADWQLHHAPDLGSAVTMLGERMFRAVICDADYGDDLWRDLLSVAAEDSTHPRVIVLSRWADERLWAEVLNLGGYDLLLKPLDLAEAHRVLTLATSVN